MLPALFEQRISPTEPYGSAGRDAGAASGSGVACLADLRPKRVRIQLYLFSMIPLLDSFFASASQKRQSGAYVVHAPVFSANGS